MKRLYTIILSVLLTAAGITYAQQEPKTNPQSSLRDGFIQLGNNIKDGVNSAGQKIGDWLSEEGLTDSDQSVTQPSAPGPGSQRKIGVVLSVNNQNNTVTVITTDGKTVSFGVTDTTIIKTQDTITGLQTPFSGGKNASFRSIKKGDWIQYSYNLGDLLKSVMPDAAADTVAAKTIDILR